MKKSSILLPLCCTALLANAGDDTKISFKWGSEYQLTKKHLDAGFVGNSKDGYTQIGHAYKKSLSFQHFTPALKLDNEKIMSLKSMPKGYMSEEFLELGGKTYWFYSTWEKPTETERLWAQEVNTKEGGLLGEPKELMKTGRLAGTLVATGIYQFNTANKYKFEYSYDKSKLLIWYRLKPTEKDDDKNYDVIGFNVFDNNMKKVWAKEIKMPYTEAMMDNNDYTVDNDGNVFALTKVYEKSRKEDIKRLQFHYEVLKYSSTSTKATIIPFKMGEKFVRSALIFQDNFKRIIVAGFYSNNRKGDGTDGAFLLRVNDAGNDFENVYKGTYEFPAEVLKQFESARTQRKMSKKDGDDDLEAAHVRLRNITVNEDGAIQLYGEEYYYNVTIYTTRYGTAFKYTHHYNDIYAMSIGTDGNMQWFKKIPKNQKRTVENMPNFTGGMSFKQYDFKGDHYLLFMDNIKNIEPNPDKAPATHVDGMGGVLMAVKIDNKGGLSKKKIFDVREEKENLLPVNFEKVGPNQLITRASKGNPLRSSGVSKVALITFE